MATIQWTIDTSHTEIGFKIKHMMISNVRGSFKKFDGTVTTEDHNLETAKIDLTIDPASVDTDNGQRDTHLRSADFFDADNYKEIHFVSDALKKKTDEEYELTGQLTIHGNTQPITLQVEASPVVQDPFGNQRVGVTVEGKISRKAFGLVWNGTMPSGDSIIGDDVFINCEMELIHK